MISKAIQGLGRLGPVWEKHPLLPSGLAAILPLDISELKKIKLRDTPPPQTPCRILAQVTSILTLHTDPYTPNPSTLSKPFLGAQAGPFTYLPGPSTGRVTSAQ